MSHFSVLVIHPKDDNIDEILAQFQENNMDTCPDAFLEFNDMEDEFRDDWENGSSNEWSPDLTKRISLESINELLTGGSVGVGLKPIFTNDIVGNRILLYDDVTQDVLVYGVITNATPTSTNSYFVELDLIDAPKSIPFKQQYDSFELFVDEYHGHSCPDDRTDRYGYWVNPNAKWDWFEIGGRWAGELRLNDGVSLDKYPTPNFSWGWDAESRQKVKKDLRVDTALVKDVKWDNILSDEDLAKKKRFWEVYVEEDPTATDEEKDKYNTYHKRSYYTDRYRTKENYLKVMNSFTTFAVIDEDGEWHEQGAMGWFGCSSADANEESEWDNSFFESFLKGLDDDMAVTVVDCHI